MNYISKSWLLNHPQVLNMLGVSLAILILDCMKPLHGAGDAFGADGEPGSPSITISRIWLGHREHEPSKVIVNWMSQEPGDSIVRFGRTANYGEEVHPIPPERLGDRRRRRRLEHGRLYFQFRTNPHCQARLEYRLSAEAAKDEPAERLSGDIEGLPPVCRNLRSGGKERGNHADPRHPQWQTLVDHQANREAEANRYPKIQNLPASKLKTLLPIFIALTTPDIFPKN